MVAIYLVCFLAMLNKGLKSGAGAGAGAVSEFQTLTGIVLFWYHIGVSTYGVGGELDGEVRMRWKGKNKKRISIPNSHMERYNFNIVLYDKNSKKKKKQTNVACQRGSNVSMRWYSSTWLTQ